MSEFKDVSYDVVPKDNIHIPFLRNTLVFNGADWSQAPTPDVNYLPNYFNKWANINKWSRNKPVVNKAESHKDFDFPKNFRSTPDGNEAYGLIYEKADVWENIHKVGWKYNSEAKGFPLRLADFKGYYAKARQPIGINAENWWVNRLTYIQVDEVNSTDIQLSLRDFDLWEGGQTYYLGFVVGDMIHTQPRQRIMEFDFRPITPNNDTERTVTAVLHPEEIKEWTNIGTVSTPFKPITLPDYEGLLMKFKKFEFISDLSFYIRDYDLYCGRLSLIDTSKNYEIETRLTGQIPEFMKKGFRYRVSYSGITSEVTQYYDDVFDADKDANQRGSEYIYRIRVGMILDRYHVEEHFERGKEIEFSLKELTTIDGADFESTNYISAFNMTMRD